VSSYEHKNIFRWITEIVSNQEHFILKQLIGQEQFIEFINLLKIPPPRANPGILVMEGGNI
jgi:hypothetical protein